MNIEHITIQSAIDLAAPGPNGRLILLDSDGVVVGCILLDMVTPPAPPSVTTVFIDACMRDDLTFDQAIRRCGSHCRKYGIRVFHLIHSSHHGVLGLREEYEEDVASLNYNQSEEVV